MAFCNWGSMTVGSAAGDTGDAGGDAGSPEDVWDEGGVSRNRRCSETCRYCSTDSGTRYSGLGLTPHSSSTVALRWRWMFVPLGRQ